MKIRGFTLIELLAVIVILAIIALIATPILMNIIDNTKKGTAERSAENYISVVSSNLVRHISRGNKIIDGDYIIDADGNLCPATEACTDETKIVVEFSGNKPVAGSIVTIVNKEVASSFMTITGYDVNYNAANGTATSVKQEPVCILVNDVNNDGLGYADEYECNTGDGKKTFYVLEDGDTTGLTDTTGRIAGIGEVTLILSANIDNEKMDWCATESLNSCNGSRVLPALEEKTANWDHPAILSIDLPTAYQVAQAGGDTTWLKFDAIQYTGKILGTWLTGNMDDDDETDLPAGYWTMTKVPNVAEKVWFVSQYGYLHPYPVKKSEDSVYKRGIRPVITILKTKLG